MDNPNIIFEIGRYLDEIHLIKFQIINKMFYKVFNSSQLWKHFKYLVEMNFKMEYSKYCYKKYKILDNLIKEWKNNFFSYNGTDTRLIEYNGFGRKTVPDFPKYYKYEINKKNFIKTIYQSSYIELLANRPLGILNKSIVELDNLTIFDCRSNNIKTIPIELTKLTQLKIISLAYNFIKSIPDEIVNLINLEKIYLHNNQLDNVNLNIKQLTNLKCCTLWMNDFSYEYLLFLDSVLDRTIFEFSGIKIFT